MRILGVDPGSVTTGFGVVDYERSRLTLVEHGSIRTVRGEDLAKRLVTIHTKLLEVIFRARPLAIAIETPFAGKNVKSLIQLSHARGVILLAAQTSGLQVFEYAPRVIKNAVVGYGAAEKEQVAKMVRTILKSSATETMGPDASDALAVAICHAHTAGSRTQFTVRA